MKPTNSNVLRPISLNIKKETNNDLKKNIPKKNQKRENRSKSKSKSKSKIVNISAANPNEDDTAVTKTSQNGVQSSSQKEVATETSRALSERHLVPLYVGDLDSKVTNDLLFQTFSEIVPVASVKICANPSSEGCLSYGYVNFYNEQDANKALNSLNYSKVLDSEIRIMPSIRDPTKKNNNWGTNVFFSHLPKHLTTRQFYESFKDYGELLSCKLNYGKQQGFILFKNREDAAKVVDKFNNSLFKGSRLYVGIHTSKVDREKQKTLLATVKDVEKTVVFVKNLPLNVSENSLREKFEKHGEIISIFIKPVSRLSVCWALITFKSYEEADVAIKNLNGSFILKNKITCTIAQKKTSNTTSNEASSSKTVNFESLPFNLTQNDIVKLCEKYGKVISVTVKTVSVDKQLKNTATVEMETVAEAKKVSQALNAKSNPEQKHHVSFVETPEVVKDEHFKTHQTLEKNWHHIKEGFPVFRSAPLMIPISNIGQKLPIQRDGISQPIMIPVPEGFQFLEQTDSTLKDLRKIVQYFVGKVSKFNTLSFCNINIISSYVLEVYWSNNLSLLKKYLTEYRVDQEDNLLKTQIEKTIKKLNTFDNSDA